MESERNDTQVRADIMYLTEFFLATETRPLGTDKKSRRSLFRFSIWVLACFLRTLMFCQIFSVCFAEKSASVKPHAQFSF